MFVLNQYRTSYQENTTLAAFLHVLVHAKSRVRSPTTKSVEMVPENATLNPEITRFRVHRPQTIFEFKHFTDPFRHKVKCVLPFEVSDLLSTKLRSQVLTDCPASYKICCRHDEPEDNNENRPAEADALH